MTFWGRVGIAAVLYSLFILVVLVLRGGSGKVETPEETQTGPVFAVALPLLAADGPPASPVDTRDPIDPHPATGIAMWPPQLTDDHMDTVLSQAGWPESLRDEAKRVAWCESRWSPGAIGDGGNSVGLFQIGRSRPGWGGWFLYFGADESQWADPVTNARVALFVYEYSGSWKQWSCKA